MVTVTLEAEDLDSPTVTSPQIYAGTAATIANLTARIIYNGMAGTARVFLPHYNTLVDGAEKRTMSQSMPVEKTQGLPVTGKKLAKRHKKLCTPATVTISKYCI
jgi:hypothetical protein